MEKNKMSQWLTGWKSIANYLDVYWKTAKKWHKEYSMPLLRTPCGKPIQQPEVLDKWLIEYNKIKKERRKDKDI